MKFFRVSFMFGQMLVEVLDQMLNVGPFHRSHKQRCKVSIKN